MSSPKGKFRIGVDTGGTFVDAVEFNEETGEFRLAKSPTTPADPTVGFINALEKLGTPLDQTYIILHGTTLGVNAILQKKGVRTGIITNKGFRDIFEIGRGDVPFQNMYDFNYHKPERIVQRRNSIGVTCRVDFNGKVLQGLDETEVTSALEYLVEKQDVKSVAVCFLHSYRNPAHEIRVGEIARSLYPGISVSLSSDVVSEYREYERTSSTVLDAYIKPLVATYLEKLQNELSRRGFRGHLLIMRSDGGVMTVPAAAGSPVSTVQSGPAGGVVGASYLSTLLHKDKIITLDIGGTSLDVCVIEGGAANVIHHSTVEDYPLLVTMYDIRSIGAGGGSISSVNHGLLQVGPESSGADPGPMCYDKGGERPTVTDAAVLLGYIDPTNFLSGDMRLAESLARKGVEQQIAKPLAMGLMEAAAGIMKITVTNSMAAIRQITVEEGRDPAEYSLVAFGGGGPLFASILAKELGIPEVVVPIAPSAFSAWGMLMCDVSYEVSQTQISLLENIRPDDLSARFLPLEAKITTILTEQGSPFSKVELRRGLELRYLGQEHALEVPIVGGINSTLAIRQSFDELHNVRYGHKMKDPIEIVNLRVKGIGVLEKPKVRRVPGRGAHHATTKPAYCMTTDSMKEFQVLQRETLGEGDTVEGPAIVDEGVARTVLHTGQTLRVDAYGNLLIMA